MQRFSMFLLAQILLTLPLFGRISVESPASSPTYGNAPAEQINATVASNGDQFLAVWLDTRENSERLYAARFTSAGALLDPTDIRIPISPIGVNRSIIAVLPIQQTWVVVWSEQVFTGDTPSARSNIMAARIDRDGRLMDSPRVVITDAYSGPGGAATNGSKIVVIYADKYAVLDENATLLRRDLALPTHGTQNSAIEVASNGSGFTIVWMANFVSGSDLEAIPLDANGNVIGDRSTLITVSASPVSLASDGNSYLLITRDFMTRDFSARRLTANAQTLEVSVLPTLAGIPGSGDLVWNGNAYVFAMVTTIVDSPEVFQQLVGVRLDSSGKPLDSEPFALSPPAPGSRTVIASIASDGRDIGSVWHTSNAQSGNDVFAAVINGASLHLSEPILLSRSSNFQTNSSLAFSGQNYLTVWQELTGTYVGRISFDGQMLDGRGIRITTAGNAPRVVFDGANYIVGWVTPSENLSTLWISRVAPDGQILDTDGVPIATSSCGFSFDMVNSGDTTLVAWDECRYHAIRVVRVDRTARPIGLPLVVTPTDMRTANPRLAWNGSEYFVAFQEQINIPSPILIPGYEAFRSHVRGVRISSGMTVLDTQPLSIAVSDNDDQAAPQAASNGKDFLVAWTKANPAEMRSRSVTSDGSLGATSTLGGGVASSLVWDGLRYALAYTASDDVFVTHVGAGDRLVISATSDVESQPQLASNGTAAYIRIATEPFYGGVSRVFLREPAAMRVRPVRR